MDENKISKLATEYALKCDPLNQTLEKQADIRQGFMAGMRQALNIVDVSKQRDLLIGLINHAQSDMYRSDRKSTPKQILDEYLADL